MNIIKFLKHFHFHRFSKWRSVEAIYVNRWTEKERTCIVQVRECLDCGFLVKRDL